MPQYEFEILISDKRTYIVEAESIDEVVMKYDGLDTLSALAEMEKLGLNQTNEDTWEPDIDLVCVNVASTNKTLWINDAFALESVLADEDAIADAVIRRKMDVHEIARDVRERLEKLGLAG